LLDRIDRRIQVVRLRAAQDRPVLAFRAGLIVFLELRSARLRGLLASFRESARSLSEARRQMLDRMAQGMMEALRRAEIELGHIGDRVQGRRAGYRGRLRLLA